MATFEDVIDNRVDEPLASGKWGDPNYLAKKYPYEPGCIWLGRNPHNHNEAIGYRTEKHVFVCAETGGGKGRAFMVNNQVLWPGSMITVGPKGDEATMAAVRRGQGNDQCEGLNQQVFVLDPFGSANVPDNYLAYYDLLEGLEADDPDLIEKSTLIATAICKVTDSEGESAEWQKRGREWVTAVLQHVVTSKNVKPKDRNLRTVRDFAMVGNVARRDKLDKQHLETLKREAAAKSESFDPRSIKKGDPYTVLLLEMKHNPACGGAIARAAEKLSQTQKNASKQFEGIKGSAGDCLQWIQGERIESVLWKTENGPQITFNAADLKDENISVFICLPERNYTFYKTWLEGMITALIQSLTMTQGLGANGERVLFCIDEFGNLGPVPAVMDALNSIRSAGVSLMIATQGLTDLQKNYPKNWQRVPSAAGLEIYFQADEVELGEYLQKKLGEKEVIKYPRTVSVNRSTSVSEALAESYSYTNSTSSTRTFTKGFANSFGDSITIGQGGSDARSENRGTSLGSGTNTGRGYGPGMFHLFDLTHTLQQGSSTQRGTTAGTGSTKTRQWNKSETRNRNFTTNESTAEGETEGRSDTYGTTRTRTEQRQDGEGASVSENHQRVPLLSLADARKHLISPIDPEHPAFPGMALVLIDQESDPYYVRKSNYDQDPYFAGKFLPNPAFNFLPLSEQPLFGWEITPEHFYRVEIPNDLVGENFEVVLNETAPGTLLEKGEPLINVSSSTINAPKVRYKSPFKLKVIEETNEEEGDGTLVVRANEVISEEKREKLDAFFWDRWREQREKAEQEKSDKRAHDLHEFITRRNQVVNEWKENDSFYENAIGIAAGGGGLVTLGFAYRLLVPGVDWPPGELWLFVIVGWIIFAILKNTWAETERRNLESRRDDEIIRILSEYPSLDAGDYDVPVPYYQYG